MTIPFSVVKKLEPALKAAKRMTLLMESGHMFRSYVDRNIPNERINEALNNDFDIGDGEVSKCIAVVIEE